MVTSFLAQCLHCGEEFTSAAPHAVYCQPSHRLAAFRSREGARLRREALVAELLRRRAADILLAEVDAEADRLLLTAN